MQQKEIKKAVKHIIKNSDDWSPAEVAYAKMIKKRVKAEIKNEI